MVGPILKSAAAQIGPLELITTYGKKSSAELKIRRAINGTIYASMAVVEWRWE
jgi:hypothetical protein